MKNAMQTIMSHNSFEWPSHLHERAGMMSLCSLHM